MAHSIEIKIYYEDTDAGGVVYYANYLRYLERARTEYLLARGIDVMSFHRAGSFFVVARVDIRYKRSAMLGDRITVTTEMTELKNASVTFRNTITRDGALLVEADVTIACVDREYRPRRFPDVFKSLQLPA